MKSAGNKKPGMTGFFIDASSVRPGCLTDVFE